MRAMNARRDTSVMPEGSVAGPLGITARLAVVTLAKAKDACRPVTYLRFRRGRPGGLRLDHHHVYTPFCS
jgi:hypothetical protein